MAHSSTRKRPSKPRKTFPLCPRQRPVGEEVHGKFFYFGPWDDPAAAEARYLREVPFILNGAAPRPAAEGLTVRDLANHFLTAQARRQEIGDIGAGHFRDLKETSQRVVDCFGRTRLVTTLTTAEFSRLREQLFARYSPSRLVSEMARVKSLFNWGLKEGLLDRPVAVGANF